MITNDNSKPDYQQVAELKSKGLKNQQIAQIMYPQMDLKSAEVKVSRLIKKPYVAQYMAKGKAQAMQELGVSWADVLDVFKDALTAVKVVTSHTEPDYTTADHSIRINAAKELAKYLPDDTPFKDSNLPDFTGMDEIELTQNKAVFKRTEK